MLSSYPNNEALFAIGSPPLRCKDGELLIEKQAANGLRKWADHFSTVRFAAWLIPEIVAKQIRSVIWVPAVEVKSASPIKIVPLPWEFDLTFIRSMKKVRQLLSEQIACCRYSHFSVASWSGDWGRQGAEVAYQLGHPYSLHIETVSYSVLWQQAHTLKAKLKYLIDYPLMKISDRRLLKRAAVVQCNGMDTYDYYQKLCNNPFLIHDIHTAEDDLIRNDELVAKLDRIRSGNPLRIRYLGRIIPIKGPLHWVQALAAAKERGTEFEAIWMGAGELESRMRHEICKFGLGDCIQIIPFEGDRKKIRDFLIGADIFLFTHLSLESSRVQKESLNFGTPIIGYHTKFAKELVSYNGGGMFARMRDPNELGKQIAIIDKNREYLEKLIKNASMDGKRFTDEKVFAERAASIRTFIDNAWKHDHIFLS